MATVRTRSMVALGYLHSAIYRHAVTSAPVSRNSAPCAAFQRRRASRFPLDESRCSCRRRALSCRRRRAKKANKISHPTHPWTLLLWRCREPDASGTLTPGSGRFYFLENACAGLEAPLHAPADIPASSQSPSTKIEPPYASVWPIPADARQL